MKTPSPLDFDVGPGPHQTIKVTFRPTGSWFVFHVVTDPSDRARIGSIAGRYEIHHQRPVLGEYLESDLLDMARVLARARAETMYRGG